MGRRRRRIRKSPALFEVPGSVHAGLPIPPVMMLPTAVIIMMVVIVVMAGLDSDWADPDANLRGARRAGHQAQGDHGCDKSFHDMPLTEFSGPHTMRSV
jgi:hypothetical protein